jgi:hypothetical protein
MLSVALLTSAAFDDIASWPLLGVPSNVAQDNEDDSALANVGVELAAVGIGPSPGPVN